MDVPRELAAAIREQGGEIVEVVHGKSQHPRRTYVVAESPRGRLHAVHGPDPRDAEIVAHEVRVRELVGVRCPLRAPPPLAWGRGWILGDLLERAPVEPPLEVEGVVEAASTLAGLELPRGPWGGRDVSLATLWRRRLAILTGGLPLADLVRARRVVRSLALPLVTGHGYFHPVHVFPDPEAAWVVDWELSGPVPAGYDLLNYWTGLADPDAQAALFEATVALVGREEELRRLRYALTVRAIMAHLKEQSDLAEARRLLELLPALRPS